MQHGRLRQCEAGCGSADDEDEHAGDPDRGDREAREVSVVGWSTASTTRSQSQALAKPASMATGTRAQTGHMVMMLPKPESATNATSTQPTLRTESVRLHHEPVTAPP